MLDKLKRITSFDCNFVKVLNLCLKPEIVEKYGKPKFDVTIDEETGEFALVVVKYPQCNLNEWKKLVNQIKSEMDKLGLGYLKSEIAIVCDNNEQDLH